MANEQFVSRYRKYGEEQPYWKAGIFKILASPCPLQMVGSEMQAAPCDLPGAIPVPRGLGVSYGVALSMVIINGFFYNLHVLLGDPWCRWITWHSHHHAFLRAVMDGPERPS
ncbi:MAG: hypothetical protein ACLT5P_07260 [Flavonifractor plautii]